MNCENYEKSKLWWTCNKTSSSENVSKVFFYLNYYNLKVIKAFHVKPCHIKLHFRGVFTDSWNRRGIAGKILKKNVLINLKYLQVKMFRHLDGDWGILTELSRRITEFYLAIDCALAEYPPRFHDVVRVFTLSLRRALLAECVCRTFFPYWYININLYNCTGNQQDEWWKHCVCFFNKIRFNVIKMQLICFVFASFTLDVGGRIKDWAKSILKIISLLT